MINRVAYAPCRNNNANFNGILKKIKDSFKTEPPKILTPKEMAEKLKKVEIELEAIGDFSRETKHQKGIDFKKAADSKIALIKNI